MVNGLFKAIDRNKMKNDELADKEMLGDILDRISDGVLLLSRDRTVVWANRASTEQTGYRLEELKGRSCHSVTHNCQRPCQPPDDACPLEEVMQTGHSSTVFHTHTNKEGGKCFVEVIVYPVLNEGGKIVRFVHVSRDVTERKRVEEELLNHKELLYVILESIVDGILAVDTKGRTILVNKNFASLWNMPQPLIDSKDDEAMLAYVLDQVTEPDDFLKKIRATYGSASVGTDIISFKDGRIVQRRTSPMFDGGGAIIGRLWSFLDITEHKRAQEIILKAKEGLEVEVEERTVLLRKTNEELSRKNAALEEVLKHIENEKQELTEKIKANIEAVIIPSLERFKDQASRGGSSGDVSDLEKNMKDLTSAFGIQMKNSPDILTTREIEICEMIRSGHSNKEISNLLNISIFTVIAHRRNIRKKLGLSNKSANLTTHLKNIE
jgi:PAS domain S-box-containing protein